MAARDLQLEAMRRYRALMGQRADWGGRLVLLVGVECVQSGAASAVSIAGGTSLALDADAAAMKAAMRAGHLDFVVNSLDEALRALKNEVRQKRPLAVGLIAQVNATLTEMSERGVAPDLRLDSEGCAQASSSGDEHFFPTKDEHFFPTKDAAALREIDTGLAAVLPQEDRVRRRWLQHAPQFLREARSGGRWIWLDEAEFAALKITPAPRPSAAPRAL
jgi:urocanate hydratase